MLPEGLEVPKRPEVDDELVEGVPPKLNFGGLSAMVAVAQIRMPQL